MIIRGVFLGLRRSDLRPTSFLRGELGSVQLGVTSALS